MTQRIRILRDALEKSLGNSLSLIAFLQKTGIVRIRDKPDFGQDRGHRRADKDNKGGLPDSAVLGAVI
jgi:hypothetical protein